MKGISLKVIPVFIIIAVVWHNHFKKHKPTAAEGSPVAGVIAKAKAEPISLNLNDKAKLSEVSQSSGENCSSLHEEILQKNTEEIYAAITLHPEQYKPQCFKTAGFKLDYVKACFGNNPEQIKENCKGFIDRFKDALTDVLYPDTLATKDLSVSVLVRKIQHKLNNFDKSQEENLKKLGEELISAIPDDSEAIKLFIMTQLTSFTPDIFLPDGKLFPYIKKGTELNPKDPNFLEMYLFGLSSGSEGVKRMKEYVVQNPMVSVAYYYLAWAHWHQKDRRASEQALRIAVHLDQANERFITSLTKVLNPKIELHNSGVFILRIDSNFNAN